MEQGYPCAQDYESIRNYINSDADKIAKRLSKDSLPIIHSDGYIIYANGTRWFLRCFMTFGLHWIPTSIEEDYKACLKKHYETMLQFQATWLPEWVMILIIKYLINNHPNLR